MAFEQHYQAEEAKLRIRDTLAALVEETLGEDGWDEYSLALELIRHARFLAMKSGKGGALNQSWFDDAIDALQRLGAGEYSNVEDLIREIGDRHLHARPRQST
jgi:hypothetical protein